MASESVIGLTDDARLPGDGAEPGSPGAREPVRRAATALTRRRVFCAQITKPLLERQRRARINRCLDELKELMSAALAAEGENLTKLEKADVLELTVRHLHQLHRDGELSLTGNPNAGAGLFGRQGPAERRRYQGGFLACAQQVASYVMKTPGLEPGLGQRLLAHLARCSQQLSPEPPPPFEPSGAQLPPFAFPPAPLPREYAVTAQFQLYRPEPGQQQQQQHLPSRAPGAECSSPEADVTGSDSADDSSPGSKRRASPEFPHVPKKRYAHCKFDESIGESDEASTSRADCYVVESRIVQLSPVPSTSSARPPSADSAKEGDSMWRPW